MKLRDLSDLIIFDTLPLEYDPKKRIILTHLLNMDKQILPEKMCSILTTRIIADRFRAYCDLKGYKGLKKDNFIYVEPYTETDITIDRRRILKMLFCASDDLSGNLMVLIKEDNKLNYIYAGNFTDIRTALLNETFALWIEHDFVQNLYLNLRRSGEDHLADDIDPIQKVLDNIQEILVYYLNFDINMYLPLLGYEHFIQKLAERYPKRVALSTKFQHLLNPNRSDALENISENVEQAKIVLIPGEPVAEEISKNLKLNKRITVYLQTKNGLEFKVEPERCYNELPYSPEPTPFDLMLLTSAMKPKRIFAIIDKNNIISIVPNYLIEFCGNTPENSQRKQGRRSLKNRLSAALNAEQAKKTSQKVVVGPLTNKVKEGLYLDDSEDSD